MTLIRVSPIKKGNYYTYNKLDMISIQGWYISMKNKFNTVRKVKQTLKPNKYIIIL